MLLTTLVATLLAAADPLVAVLELNVKADNAGLDRGYFSDRVRGAVLKAAPQARLMTRDNIEVLARAAGVDLAQCEGECAVDTGRKLGADTIITGDVVRVGALLKLTLRMHDVRDARLLSVAQASGRTPEELDTDLDRVLPELVAPLRPGAPPRATAPATAPPRADAPLLTGQRSGLIGLLLRDAISGSAGFSVVNPEKGRGEFWAHVFGVELRRSSWKSFEPVAQLSGAVERDFRTWELGVAPVTFTLPLLQWLELQWFQPYAAVAFGSVDVLPSLPTAEATSSTFSGFRAGSRFGLLVLPGPVSVRLGVDVSYANYGSDNLYAPQPGLTVSPFGGLVIGL